MDCSPLTARVWASGWLGVAWAEASLGERDPESRLVVDVVGRARRRPTRQALAALHALRTVSATEDHDLLDESITTLEAVLSRPAWVEAGPFEAKRGWIVRDVWDASTLVFVAIEGPDPFDMVALVTSEGGVVVDTLGIADPGAVDHITTGADTPVAMQPATEVPVAEALTTLAQGLRESDMA